MKLISILSAFTLLFLASCGESTDAVESGTYKGTISEVEAEKSEIYVKTDDDKTLELYFIEETVLTKNGENAEFSALEEGQKVEVEVEKVGQRLDPLSVNIIE
tara:strand:- start:169997 stop:170305 length:309 start_codon:yes stop_codon:yes gene_type:complete